MYCKDRGCVKGSKRRITAFKHFHQRLICCGNAALSRGVFKTLSNAYNGTFYENSQRLKAVHYFYKKLQHRCLL